MTKHRLNEYAIFSAEHNVIDIYEFQWDAENVLKEHQSNGDYKGAYVSNVMVTVESIDDMRRTAIDAIKSVMTDYEIEDANSFHFEGLHAAIHLLELGVPSDD